MKLLIQFNDKNYVIKVEALKTVDQLKSQITSNINNAPSEFNIQYYDEDFKTYIELTSVGDVGNMSKLKIQKAKATKQSNVNTSKRKILSPSLNKKKSPIPETAEKTHNSNDCSMNEAIMKDMKSKILKIIPPSSNVQEVLECISKAISDCTESHNKSSNTDLSAALNGVSRPEVVDTVVNKFQFLNSVLGRSAIDTLLKETSKTFKQKRILDNESTIVTSKRKREDETSDVKRHSIGGSRTDVTKILLAAGGLPSFLPVRRKSQTDEEIEKLRQFMNKQVTVDNPEFNKVSQALDHTLSDRRKYMVYGDHTIKQKHKCYPWIFTEKELIREFSRICNEDMNMKDRLFSYFNKVCFYVKKLVKNDTITNLLEQLDDKNIIDAGNKAAKEQMFKMALVGIPNLLNEDIFHLFVKETETCSTVSRICIHFSGSEPVFSPGTLHLCVDGNHIILTSLRGAVCASLAAHYAFNIGYSSQLFNFFTFIESEIFRLKTCQGPPQPVKRMMKYFKTEYKKNS